MTKAIFEARHAQPLGQSRQLWDCVIPVDAKTELNAATYDDLLRSDYWQQFANVHHVEPGDLIFATAADQSFKAVLAVRGVDRKHLRVVVAPMMSGDFRDEPILIGQTIIIQKSGKAWSVHRKVKADASALELIKGGLASAEEARSWTERMALSISRSLAKMQRRRLERRRMIVRYCAQHHGEPSRTELCCRPA